MYGDAVAFIKKPVKITENIYLGNGIVATECAKSNEFGLIISVMTEHEFNTYFNEIRINNDKYNQSCANLADKVNHVMYWLNDSSNPADFDDYNLFKVCWFICGHINSKIFANKKVLIHCAAGMNRSVTVIIAYLINSGEFKNLGYFDLKQHILNRRGGVIMTNPYFENYLIEYEKRVKALKD